MAKGAGKYETHGPGSSGHRGQPSAGQAGGKAAGGDGGAEDQEVAIGWKLAGLGFQVASEVGAGALLGWLVDRWLNSAPTGLLVGAIAGISVGLWSLIRGALKLNRQLDEIAAGRKSSMEASGARWQEWKDDAEDVDDTFDNSQPGGHER
jgi:F0F1-type ATP synthase assembly protein I